MKPQKLGFGGRCPKCGKVMIRLGHKPGWRPKPGQKYYFSYYDWCPKKHHIQLYERAKVLVDPQGEEHKEDELTLAFKATIGTPADRDR